MANNGTGFGGALTSLLSSGALGVGIVLVAVPSVMLFAGLHWLQGYEVVGLPLMAIFGIMILFGSLALVSMLFNSLGLDDKTQPLGLPEGSIRAAIALSLIVLFAIISIMLFRSGGEGRYEVGNLSAEQRQALMEKAPDRVLEVIEQPCAKPGCGEDERRYRLVMRSPAPSATQDIAKQLLTLIGTLMTSLTSYYFAARGALSSASGQNPPDPAAGKPGQDKPLDGAADAAGEGHVDGCNVPITNPTPDHALPAARGGVEAQREQ